MSKVSEQKSHAIMGASTAERWLECPGSIALGKDAPPQFESEYAAEGTKGHACLEALLNSRGKLLQTADFLKKTYGTEMVEHALFAVREVEKRLSKGSILLAEERCDLTHIDKDMWGTTDIAIVDLFGRLTVLDYKYGQGYAVEPEENAQLVFYALGVAHKYDYNFTEVCLGIIQPRAFHEKGPIREWVISIDTLMEWSKKFEEGAKRVHDKNAPFKPGEHCRWCPAKTICPELSTKALAQAQIDFSEDGTEVILPKVSKSDILSLDPERLGATLSALDRIEIWMGEMRSYAFEAMKRGKAIPGWKLAEKRSIRKWVDAAKVAKEADKKYGEFAFSRDLLSPAQLEKIGPGAKDWVEKRCSAISSGLTMVPENDPRPAVNQIELDFKDAPKQNALEKSRSVKKGK